jgi:hypothetical protein
MTESIALFNHCPTPKAFGTGLLKN